MYSVPLLWNRWCGPFMLLPVLRLYVFVKFNPSPLPTHLLEKSLSKPLRINDSLSLYNTAFRNLLGSLFLGLFTSEVKGFFCLFSKTLSRYSIRLLFFSFCFLWKQRTTLWNLAYNNFSYACWLLLSLLYALTLKICNLMYLLSLLHLLLSWSPRCCFIKGDVCWVSHWLGLCRGLANS